MLTSVVPPTRKSIRHIGDEKPCGPHHLVTRSGSLHARQTRSSDASNVRVNTTSWVVSSVDILRTSFRLAVRSPPAVHAFATPTDVVGHVHRLVGAGAGPPAAHEPLPPFAAPPEFEGQVHRPVGAGVGPPAATEPLAVVIEGAGERRVQGAVGH